MSTNLQYIKSIIYIIYTSWACGSGVEEHRWSFPPSAVMCSENPRIKVTLTEQERISENVCDSDIWIRKGTILIQILAGQGRSYTVI